MLVVYVHKMKPTYLETVYEILNSNPVIIVKFIHIVSGVPACHDIMGDKLFLDMQLAAEVAPSRKSDHGQMDDGKCKFPYLDK